MKYTKCDICCCDIEEDKIILKPLLDKYWKICPRCYKTMEIIEKDKTGILEIFATIYTYINNCPKCGSQRCDGSPEWMEGCEPYKKLLISLKREEDEYLRRKNNSNSEKE